MTGNGQDYDGPVLECKDLCISYFTRAGEIPAVIDFNLKLHRGESVGLVGESGCGKSTVAMAIMQYLGGNGGIVGGQVLYKGRDLATFSAEELRQLRGNEIAMVYQEPMASLNPSMTLGRQLMEVPLCHDNVTEAEARERSLEMLAGVKIPDPVRVLESYPHQVSGGQQQRVVIAMALLSKPTLLLLDEPTTALDVTVEAGIIELIAEIAGRFNTSMIYISHNLGLILATCDRINVMYSGVVVEEGTVKEVFDEMRHPYTKGLFGAIPLPSADKQSRPLVPIRGQLPLPHERPLGCFFGPRCDHFQEEECGHGRIDMTGVGTSGHRVRCARWQNIDWASYRPEGLGGEEIKIGEEVLNIRKMRKYYEIVDNSILALIKGDRIKYVKANESISFDARESETVAIVGESGCGKSTFAKVLMGLETATDGEVVFRDQDVANFPVQKRAPDMVGSVQMVFQNPFDTLNPSHSVGAQLARVIRKFGVEHERERVEQRVLELLDLVKLPRDFARRRPRQLSGGQKQRVGIARAFAGNPAMVVADEPVSALDVSVQAQVLNLLLELQQELHLTYLFVAHDLSVVKHITDRVAVMYVGKLVETAPTDELFYKPRHPYTAALMSAVPVADPRVRSKMIPLEGDVPSPANPPSGCYFHPRCPHAVDTCRTQTPVLEEFSPNHYVSCHRARELDLQGI
jgi:peptide/nickel transport system ATP-binding protein